MEKRKTKRINLVVDDQLYDHIKKNADGAHLRVGTYTKIMVIEAQKNNFIIKLNNDGNRI